MNNNLKRKYLAEFKRLREIVNRIDPAGLVSGGAPFDEYDQEISELLVKTKNIFDQKKIQEIIKKVFIDALGNDSIINKNFDKEIAKELKNNEG